jgi:pimeloyl-ACP methyl ester carboxylesterase
LDGATIAYHDEGSGPAVVLLHGFGVDGLGQYGHFDRNLPLMGFSMGAGTAARLLILGPPQVKSAILAGMTAEELNRIRVPVLVLNGKADVANQRTAGLLKEIPMHAPANARATIPRRLTK